MIIAIFDKREPSVQFGAVVLVMTSVKVARRTTVAAVHSGGGAAQGWRLVCGDVSTKTHPVNYVSCIKRVMMAR